MSALGSYIVVTVMALRKSVLIGFFIFKASVR